ncbi:MAG TPA: ABC transporter permease [Caldithrix abyssi]|uniref:ABC transporter permease n=1 Tax=Caldithrix abyssi TaxID=187145 RepID=A0A7V1PTA2_CALAY|nr:ABC transporter permease [Caldithrix abyssi]
MKRIYYLVRKEFRQILREPAYIGILFIMPVVQIILLGYAITTDVKNIKVGIVDLDQSPMSERLVEAYTRNNSFIYYGSTDDERVLIRWLDDGRISLGMVIPLHFQRDLINGRQPDVQMVLDGVDGNSAGVVAAYAAQVTVALQKEWLPKVPPLQKKAAALHITTIEPRMWYNPDLKSVNNIVPGIIATLLTMVTLLVTAMSIVREKELGTLEQLMVTPLRKGELMIGKIIPFEIAGFLLVNVSILAAGWIFGIWIVGSVWTLYLMSLIFSLSTLGVGILTSTMARTQQQAMFIAWFFMVFSLLLSGFFIPIKNMPDIIQGLTYLNPMRYFMVVIREIYLKGTPLEFLWKEGVAMLTFGVASFVLATVRFSKRIG